MTPRTLTLSLLLLCLTASAQFGLRSPAFVGSLAPMVAAGGAPSTPTGLAALADGASGITVTWNDVSGEDAYRLQYSYDFGAFADITGDDANPTAADVVSFFTGYSGTTMADPGEFCLFRFKIRAENAFGNSSYSSIVQTPPSLAVADLDAPINPGVGVDLAWHNFESYSSLANLQQHVWRSINGGAFTDIATVAFDATSYSDNSGATVTALGLMQSIDYKVRSVNDGGNGVFSNIATAHP